MFLITYIQTYRIPGDQIWWLFTEIIKKIEIKRSNKSFYAYISKIQECRPPDLEIVYYLNNPFIVASSKQTEYATKVEKKSDQSW